MARTDKFRQEHCQMVRLIAELQLTLNESRIALDASEARACVSRLLGKLTLHLESEDKTLYPELEKSSDPNVVSLATRFAREMREVAPNVAAYGKRWPTSASIMANPRAFIFETKSLTSTLAARLQREDRELYAAADRAWRVASLRLVPGARP